MVCGGVVIKTMMMMVITGCQHFYPNGSVEVFEFLYVVFKLLRRRQDTGENLIVTLKISEEKVIYGVLDGVNNPTNSCGIWSFQNNTEVLQWRRHAEVGAAETDS